MDKGSNIETKSSVQESFGIFQLIDQLETAVDKLLEMQVYYACTVQVGVIKTDFATVYLILSKKNFIYHF
jgi:succinate dehydrogenase/fumarate reductase flavoprotein subunit